MRRALLVVAVAAAAFAAAGSVWRHGDAGAHDAADGPAPPAAAQPAVPGATGAVAAVPGQAAPTANSKPAGPLDQQLALPDGTYVPCLNGARGAPDLALYWGDRPFSPIVSIRRTDLGVDWYVHADGTQTTTEMKWRADLGRFDAMTRIAVPMDRTPPVQAQRATGN